MTVPESNPISQCPPTKFTAQSLVCTSSVCPKKKRIIEHQWCTTICYWKSPTQNVKRLLWTSKMAKLVWAFRFTTPMCHLRWWHQTRIHLSPLVKITRFNLVNARWYNLTYLTRPCRLSSLLIFCASGSNSIDPTDLTQRERESRDDWSALVCVVCVRNLLLLLVVVYFSHCPKSLEKLQDRQN